MSGANIADQTGGFKVNEDGTFGYDYDALYDRIQDQKNSPKLLESLSNLPPRYESNVPEQVKINARQKLIRLEKQLEAGKITDVGYRLGVQKVIDGLEMQRSARDVRQIEAGRRPFNCF